MTIWELTRDPLRVEFPGSEKGMELIGGLPPRNDPHWFLSLLLTRIIALHTARIELSLSNLDDYWGRPVKL